MTPVKNRSEKRLSRHTLANAVFLITALFAIMVLSGRENYARQMQQIEGYIDVLSQRTAEHVGDVLGDRLDAIKTIAYLYGESLTEEGVWSRHLAEVEKGASFDRIRFVTPAGASFASNGKVADVADRDYLIKGMAGESGITVVMESRFDGKQVIGFYAPVSRSGEICGVMVGFIEEETMSDILTSEIYGLPAFTMLVDETGRALGQYYGDNPSRAKNLSDIVDYIDESQQADVTDALTSRVSVGFDLMGSKGSTVGDIVPVGGTDWSLVQLFPSGAARDIVDKVNRDERFVMLLFGIVGLTACGQFIYSARRKAALEREKETRDRMISILQSAADDYICLISVDLETEIEEQFRLDGGDVLGDWAGGNYDYTHCIESYAESIVCEQDRERFLEATRLSVLRQQLARQKDIYIEYDAVLSGRRRRLQGKFTMDQDSAGRPRMVIGIRDITELTEERDRMTEEMRRARDAAESANRAKSAFLFNMSHDIRTPMNAIMGFSAMAEKYIGDRERVADCLKKINLSGEHLLKLINNILDLARIESGRSRLEIQACDISSEMRNIEYIFQADVSKKGLELRIESDIKNSIVFCDILKIHQIELNLIGNAIKYTPPGGHIVYSVRQTGLENGVASYHSSVKDDGIGMSPEFVGHVFESFEREHSGVVTGIEGSGLGLSITKRLVEEMGGSITCESVPGHGSEFIFELSFPVGALSDLRHETVGGEESSDLRGKRVLLVEDNALNREISRELLETEGIIVDEADDGDVAVEKVRWSIAGYYDVILMDVQMPRLDGFSAARQIRALPDPQLSRIPILALTANAFDEDRRAVLEAGMNGHVAKPVDIRELRARLKDCL